MSEEKTLASQIMEATNYLREQADKMTEERKSIGVATAESKAALEKASNRIDQLEAALQKTTLVKPGEAKDESRKARSAAFLKWMRYGKANLEPAERKALIEDTTGLYLVPEEIEAEIIRAVPQYNVFRNLSSIVNVGRDKLRKRTLAELTMSWGKIEGSASITESTQVPTSTYIYVEDLYGLTKIGEDELADVDFNLAAVIADSFSIARANTEEAGFAIGRGHATYEEPDGIAVDATLQTDIGNGAGAGATGTYGINWDTDDTLTIAEVLECEYRLPTQYLNGASWLMNRKTELVIRGLRAGGYTATDGPWLWQPSLQAGQPKTIDGFPVYNNNSMKFPADTTAGINIIFGNFKLGYRIVDRLGMTMQRLDELYSEAGMVGFKSHFRVGGSIIRPDAFQVICNDV